MKRLLLVLLLIPSFAFGAFTEFYCDPTNGDNRNSGSDSGTSVYTATNGNWSTATHIYTVTNGTNPATASPGAAVGQFASIYLDGATTTVFIGRITAVQNATNGTITIVGSSGNGTAGTAPTTLTTGRTIKVGGCWKGPNAASPFPFNSASGLNALGTAYDSNSEVVRINLKNNASYSISANIANNAFSHGVVQGYSSTVGDGGKATIDGSTNAISLLSNSVTGTVFADLIFVSSASSGSSDLVGGTGGAGCAYNRCIFHGGRASGLNVSAGNVALNEDEFYSNNGSNTTNAAGCKTVSVTATRCYSHDNTGSGTDGFGDGNASTISSTSYTYCIADSNGRVGFNLTNESSPSLIQSCDSYNNGTDGLKFLSSGTGAVSKIENSNFLKNGGWGINITGSATTFSYVTVDNCGYGSGTQANSSGTSTGVVYDNNPVTYASGAQPWVAASTGNFKINSTAALGAGRGAFTQTGNSKTGTVGFPDVGAAQSLTGSGGTFSKEVSGGYTQ